MAYLEFLRDNKGSACTLFAHHEEWDGLFRQVFGSVDDLDGISSLPILIEHLGPKKRSYLLALEYSMVAARVYVRNPNLQQQNQGLTSNRGISQGGAVEI